MGTGHRDPAGRTGTGRRVIGKAHFAADSDRDLGRLKTRIKQGEFVTGALAQKFGASLAHRFETFAVASAGRGMAEFDPIAAGA